MASKLEDWFSKLFFKPLVMVAPCLRINYSLAGQTITETRPLGRKVSMRIDELDEIGIETTDQGPFIEDVFWILKQGDVTIRIPQPHPVFELLMERLGSLEGFDWRPFNEAMSYTDNRYFLCWRRPTAIPCPAPASSTS